MTQGERVKAIRKELNYTLEKFGEKIGVQRSAISKIERGERGVTDQMAKSICREFNVDPYWLETGEGEMFIQLSEDDELVALVFDSLTDKENPFFQLILATMKAYRQLTPEHKEALHTYLENVLNNLQSSTEGNEERKEN